MTPRYGLWSQVEGTMTFNADNSMALQDVNTTAIQDGYNGRLGKVDNCQRPP